MAYALGSFENCTGLPGKISEKMGHRLYHSVICSRLTHVCHILGILHTTRYKVLECAMLGILKE